MSYTPAFMSARTLSKPARLPIRILTPVLQNNLYRRNRHPPTIGIPYTRILLYLLIRRSGVTQRNHPSSYFNHRRIFYIYAAYATESERHATRILLFPNFFFALTHIPHEITHVRAVPVRTQQLDLPLSEQIFQIIIIFLFRQGF